MTKSVTLWAGVLCTCSLIFLLDEIVAQNKPTRVFQIIQLKEFYDGKGAIIPDKYECVIFSAASPAKNRFTPQLDQIKNAEEVLLNQLDSLDCYDLEKIKKKKAELRRFYRQYIGYINSDNQKIIMIHMLNFAIKDAATIFSGWERDFVDVVVEVEDVRDYEEYTKTIEINLELKKIERENSTGL